MAETVVDLNLDKIKGIGPKTKEKLIDNGITSVLDLAVTLPKELEEILGGKEENVNSFIISARRFLEESGLLEREFITASELMEKRKAMGRITTSSTNLDELLSGSGNPSDHGVLR